MTASISSKISRMLLAFVLTLVLGLGTFAAASVDARAEETKAESDGSNIYISDDAELLSDEEEAKLKDQLMAMDGTCNYMVIVENDYVYSYTMQDEMEGWYTSKFGTRDGVCFLINMGQRELYMGAMGSLKKYIGNDDALDVTDNVYTYASAGDYYTCISKAYDQMDSLINGRFILRPMRYITAILMGLIFGFLIMFIVMVASRKTSAPQGTMPKGLKVTSSSRNMVMIGAMSALAANIIVHKTRHVESSSSSGGGGGGFSGGGGGGGGMSGGGHSF